MKRNLTIGLTAALLAAAALPAVASAAVTITVEPAPEENVYAPADATLDLGDGPFTWQWGPNGAGALDVHNLLERHALFGSGDAVAKRAPYSVTASAGSFHYYCTVHLGMEGDVRVRPVLLGGATASSGSTIPFGWADSLTTTGNKFDVRYSTGGKWKSWLKKTKKRSAKFGKRKKPVKVKSGRTYEFQVRSRQGSDKSSWSPSLVVER